MTSLGWGILEQCLVMELWGVQPMMFLQAQSISSTVDSNDSAHSLAEGGSTSETTDMGKLSEKNSHGETFHFFRELICIKNDVEIHLIIPPTCERFCLKLYLLPVLTEMEGLLWSSKPWITSPEWDPLLDFVLTHPASRGLAAHFKLDGFAC